MVNNIGEGIYPGCPMFGGGSWFVGTLFGWTLWFLLLIMLILAIIWLTKKIRTE